MSIGKIGEVSLILGGLAVGAKLDPHDVSATGSDIPSALRNLADKAEAQGALYEHKPDA